MTVSRWKSVFLFISPSDAFQEQIRQLAVGHSGEKYALSWQNIIRTLVTDCMKGWQEYMAWMEREIKEHVRCNVLFTPFKIRPVSINLYAGY
jgi:hypothetical protein